ncbi:MAG: excinuclease ABC subunit UvrC [Candidatus Dojkabacteria bacterium]|nr:excinuclease ABC subunit UvrC [Candidatus Dojkabacteria bacterium]
MIREKFNDLIKKAESLPASPGCYMFLNKDKQIIYVGKAKNLRNRVKSYFYGFDNLEKRKQNMILETVDLEYVVVDSEIEAIILETNLIKKYKTKYNILMRDDRTYSWIQIDSSKTIDFPRIRVVRDKDKHKYNGYFFGPFPDTNIIQDFLKKFRKIFPYASCNRTIKIVSNNPLKVVSSNSKPCLYYYIGLCQAPCAGYVTKTEYLKNIQKIKDFLEGKKQQIIKKLEKEMKKYANNLDFEQAIQIRNKINQIKYVTQKIKLNSNIDDVSIKDIKEEERREALYDLLTKIDYPKSILSSNSLSNFKIECYDISNLQGTNAVGSMVVAINGIMDNKLYRRFAIKKVNYPNDYVMLQEILDRRFKNLCTTDESFSVLPNLIIIDGGKGQLMAGYEILKKYNLQHKIPIISIAKKEEEIYKLTYQFFEQPDNELINTTKKFTIIRLPKHTEALFLIQRIRDEAHRFGLSYHKQIRLRNLIKYLN